MIARRLAALALLAVLVVVADAATEKPRATAAMPPGMPAMAEYRFGLLTRGPGWTPGRTPATDSIQAGHMANIHRMAAEGVLLAAGPFVDGGDLRGVFIFGADTTERITGMARFVTRFSTAVVPSRVDRYSG